MALISSNTKTGYWHAFIKDNFGLLATFVSFFVISSRLLVVSHGNRETALFLLSHSDKVPLLVGMFLPYLPYICIFVSLTLYWALWVYGPHQSELVLNLIRFFMFLFGFAGWQTGHWNAIYIGFLQALLWLAVPWRTIFSNKRQKWLKDPDKKLHLFHNGDGWDSPYMLVIAISPFFLTAGQSWLPSECVTLQNGTNINASVLSVDQKYSYLVKLPEFKPVVISSASIQERQVDPGNTGIACKAIRDARDDLSRRAPIVPRGINGPT